MNGLVRIAQPVRVVAAVALEVALVAALIALGRRPELAVPFGRVGPWLRDAPPADAVVALLRWVALVGASWLLASTLLYLAVAVSHAPAALRATRWSTLPMIRRLVDATVAVSVVSEIALAPAAAVAPRAGDPPAATVVRDGRTGRRRIAELPADSTNTPTTTAAPRSAPAMPSPVVATLPPSPPSPPAPDVVVAPGDNLWELAARHLAASSARTRGEVSDAEIGPYWLRVCDANRTRLASGDPNLVYPGERVTLPPLS
jgi:hypothetical protein